MHFGALNYGNTWWMGLSRRSASGVEKQEEPNQMPVSEWVHFLLTFNFKGKMKCGSPTEMVDLWQRCGNTISDSRRGGVDRSQKFDLTFLDETILLWSVKTQDIGSELGLGSGSGSLTGFFGESYMPDWFPHQPAGSLSCVCPHLISLPVP